MRASAGRPFVIAVVVLACALYLPQLVWPAASFYVDVLSPWRLLFVGSMAKLACLAMGAVYGWRVVTRLDRANPARVPWFFIAAWLALWTCAQIDLMIYPLVLGRSVPVPSPADVAFLLGYACVFIGLIRFVFVYRASGFPVGSGRQHAAIAVIGALLVAAIVIPLLVPVARAQTNLVAGTINVGYPLIDLAALIPTIVLLRIAIAFRPGRIWEVWVSLIVGFLFMAIGDVVASYVWPSETAGLDPLIHLGYVLGYFFVGWGTKLQWELVAGGRR